MEPPKPKTVEDLDVQKLRELAALRPEWEESSSECVPPPKHPRTYAQHQLSLPRSGGVVALPCFAAAYAQPPCVPDQLCRWRSVPGVRRRG